MNNTGQFITERLSLKRDDASRLAAVSFSCTPLPALLNSKEEFLHSEELEKFSSMQYEARQSSYLLGRFCGKHAITTLDPSINPRDIRIRPGVFTQPVVDCRGSAADIQISISHSHGWGTALAFPEEHPMAIDIEQIEESRIDTIKTQLTTEEMVLLDAVGGNKAATYTAAWTAKEALSKALKCGMMTPFAILEVKEIIRDGMITISLFKNFFQYKAISFSYGEMMCSIVTPKKTELEWDLQLMISRLESLAGNSK